MAWRVQVVGGVRHNKGEAGGYVLQLGAASHRGVGIPTAHLHIILQLGAAYHCGVGSPQHKLFQLFIIFFVSHLFICF